MPRAKEDKPKRQRSSGEVRAELSDARFDYVLEGTPEAKARRDKLWQELVEAEDRESVVHKINRVLPGPPKSEEQKMYTDIKKDKPKKKKKKKLSAQLKDIGDAKVSY